MPLSCPISHPQDPADIYNATKEDVNYAISHPFRIRPNPVRIAVRTRPHSPSDEFELTNLEMYHMEGDNDDDDDEGSGAR